MRCQKLTENKIIWFPNLFVYATVFTGCFISDRNSKFLICHFDAHNPEEEIPRAIVDKLFGHEPVVETSWNC